MIFSLFVVFCFIKISLMCRGEKKGIKGRLAIHRKWIDMSQMEDRKSGVAMIRQIRVDLKSTWPG
jgi:hypothetical protein